jgi:hypothetical protein
MGLMSFLNWNFDVNCDLMRLFMEFWWDRTRDRYELPGYFASFDQGLPSFQRINRDMRHSKLATC